MRTILSMLLIIGISLRLSAQDNSYKEISLPDLMKKKGQEKGLVILDVRTNGEYYDTSGQYKQGNIGRIKGTLHVELQDLLENPQAIKELDSYKDKEIYVICSHSYRSRVASNYLLKNGFSDVTNVRGGMTEWFRRADELEPYKAKYYETKNTYGLMAPAELAERLIAGKDTKLIGIASEPRYWYDSFMLVLYRYLPAFKNAAQFSYADSLRVLEEARKANGKTIVLYSTVNSGASELAEWLTGKGIKGVSALAGSLNYFYEYLQNKNLVSRAAPFMKSLSPVDFITSAGYCAHSTTGQLIDLREDSLFNKVTTGTKYKYKHLRNATNFFSGNGVAQFEKQFGDKGADYYFMSQNGSTGMQFADELARKGYHIHWIMGGMQRWEWYMNNVEDFGCMGLLVE